MRMPGGTHGVSRFSLLGSSLAGQSPVALTSPLATVSGPVGAVLAPKAGARTATEVGGLLRLDKGSYVLRSAVRAAANDGLWRAHTR